MAKFYYLHSVQETLALLYQTRSDHCIIAGGTDAVVQMKRDAVDRAYYQHQSDEGAARYPYVGQQD